jgi:hypothetical protein
MELSDTLLRYTIQTRVNTNTNSRKAELARSDKSMSCMVPYDGEIKRKLNKRPNPIFQICCYLGLTTVRRGE